MSNVPNVNFFIGYAKPQSRKDVMKGENVGTERDFYSSNQSRDYVEYVNSGSKEKIDFVEYSGNKEKSHGIFNADGLMEKSEIKELRNELKQTKSVIWHGVISFTEEFGNTYCDTTEKAIAMMKVEMPKFFRPPMGKYSDLSLKYTDDLGYTSVFWSFAYKDWLTDNQPSKEDGKKKILEKAHNGEVMLLHAVSDTNLAILGDIIKELKNQGYEFKSLNDFS